MDTFGKGAHVARTGNRRRALIGGLAAAAAGMAVLAPAASAVPASHVSSLVSATTEVDLTIPLLQPPTPRPTQNVTVNLDPATCPQALDGGLTYGVTATTDDSDIATVAGPLLDAALQCSAPSPTTATFTVSPVSCGSTNVNFFPVVANPSGKVPPGAQSKVGSLSIPVVVTDANNPDCASSDGDGSGSERPAAPSVANTYITGAGTTLTDGCKAHGFVQKGKFSRGALISAVAAWMPRPESIKNDTGLYPESGDWTDYVRSAVDAYCSGTALPALPLGTSNNL